MEIAIIVTNMGEVVMKVVAVSTSTVIIMAITSMKTAVIITDIITDSCMNGEKIAVEGTTNTSVADIMNMDTIMKVITSTSVAIVMMRVIAAVVAVVAVTMVMAVTVAVMVVEVMVVEVMVVMEVATAATVEVEDMDGDGQTFQWVIIVMIWLAKMETQKQNGFVFLCTGSQSIAQETPLLDL